MQMCGGIAVDTRAGQCAGSIRRAGGGGALQRIPHPCRSLLLVAAAACNRQHHSRQTADNSLPAPAQAVYGVLKEAEHRSTFYIPYWNLPLAAVLVPRQRRFRADLAVINACLDGLIATAKSTRQATDEEALQARDYSKARSRASRRSSSPGYISGKVIPTSRCVADSAPCCF